VSRGRFSSNPLPCRARPRAGPFGLGPPSRPHLCGACTWQRRLKIPAISSSSRYPLRRGFAAPIQARLGLLIPASRSASLRLPARRLLRARREAHPIGDRIEAPVQARQRRRRCPPEPSTRCRTMRMNRSAHMPQGGVFTLPSESLLPAGRETSASLLPGENIYATRYPDGPQPTLSLQSIQPSHTPHWRSSRGPGPSRKVDRIGAPVLRLW